MEKSLHRARTLQRFRTFPASHSILCVSLPSVSLSLDRRRNRNEKKDKRKEQAIRQYIGGQSVIFISESFAPFVRNPERTHQSSPRAPSNPISLYFHGS